MTGIHDLALFVAAGLLLNLTPGPDMAYIAARSRRGRLSRRRRGDVRHHRRMRRAHAGGGARALGAARDVGGGVRGRQVVRRRVSALRRHAAARRRQRCATARRERRTRRSLPPAPPRRIFREALRHQRVQSEGRAVLPRVPAAVHRRRRARQGAGVRAARLPVQLQQPVRQPAGRVAREPRRPGLAQRARALRAG